MSPAKAQEPGDFTPVTVEWCAGLFVGEGSTFTRCRKNTVPQVVISLSMLDEQAIRSFAGYFGLSVETLSYFRNPARSLYRCRASGLTAVSVLVAMLPAMGHTDKAAQSRRVLAEGLVALDEDDDFTLLGPRASDETRRRMSVSQRARREREKART